MMRNQKLRTLLRPLGLLFVAATVLFSVSATAKKTKQLSLYVGIYHDVKVSDAPASLALKGTFRKLTKVQYNSTSQVLRFYPKKTGTGTVIVTNKRTGKVLYEFTVSIKNTDLKRVALEVQSLLQNIEGINIKILNNKVIVDGQILLPNDMKRIHSVVKQYGDLATSLVTLSPLAQNKIAQFIERKINNPEIHVTATNQKFILEGVAGDPNEKARAEILAKMYVPDVVVDEAVADKKVLERKADVVINLITVRKAPESPPPKIIQMVVHYVELQKEYTKGFRFQWTPTIGEESQIQFSSGGRAPGGVLATITGTISNLLPKLNWAKQHGVARVLQSSSLIVEDGKPGAINSTTRLPYQVVNAQGQPSTNFEETGLRANITPQVMGARSDSVKLAMNFSVKSLISYSDQGPLTAAREIQTTIHVRSGKSAAVGGLITSDQATNYNKLPPNTSTNPLISLYASKDFRKNQSQFVVFITPIIKSSASAGSDKIKRKFRVNN